MGIALFGFTLVMWVCWSYVAVGVWRLCNEVYGEFLYRSRVKRLDAAVARFNAGKAGAERFDPTRDWSV